MSYTLSQFISYVKAGEAVKVKCTSSNSIYPIYIGNQEVQISDYYDLGTFHTSQTVLECYGLRRGLSDGILLAEEGDIPLAVPEVDVSVQDQTTRIIDSHLAMAGSGPLTLAANTVPDQYTITMTAGHGLSNNDNIGIFSDGLTPQAFYAKVLNVNGNVLTLDSPMDKIFLTSSALVFKLVLNANLDGSSARKIFFADNSTELPYDITRVNIHLLDDVQMDDGKFGGITALTRGCVLRVKRGDGTFENLFNFKSNEEIIHFADKYEYNPKAPSGVYGFSCNLAFGGQANHGVVLRLNQFDRLEFIVQDNLAALTSVEIVMIGHFTSGEYL